MTKPRIGVVIGSTRPGRFADKPAEWIAERAGDKFDVEVLDLRDYELPFYNETTSPSYGKLENDQALRWQEKLGEFDGFIILAAEYNHGPTAVLKNALDHAFHEWGRKPVAFIGYGGVGGARAVEQLRLVAIELRMAPISPAVHILMLDFLAVYQGEKSLGELDHLNKSADDMLTQLEWWANTLKAARLEDKPAQEAA